MARKYFDPSDRAFRGYCENCSEERKLIDSVCRSCAMDVGSKDSLAAWKQYERQGYTGMHAIIKSFPLQWHITEYGLECHEPYLYSIKSDRLWEQFGLSYNGRFDGWPSHMIEKEWCFVGEFEQALEAAREYFSLIHLGNKTERSNRQRWFREREAKKTKIMFDRFRDARREFHLYNEEIEMQNQNNIVRFHQSENGSKSISTNAGSEESFLREVESALAQRVQSEGEFAQGWLKPICDIVCKLRGYKADVTEHRVIVAGEWVPDDVVDALTKTSKVESRG